MKEFVRLHNTIVDKRYGQSQWRTSQNYVSQTMRDYTEHVYFVPPKPEDVPGLMSGWMRMVERLKTGMLDPVTAAATASFAFVLIHPFDDGNGRLHRFLIHHMLAQTGFAPEGLLFPVSIVMLKDRGSYERVLERYSSSILPFIDWAMDIHQRMTVKNNTAWLYRYVDVTPFAEYLYKCVAETIRTDLKSEMSFLVSFDAAMARVADIVDIPNQRASLLIRLIRQNNGSLSARKRKEFAELTR